jgi:hypothetical protein
VVEFLGLLECADVTTVVRAAVSIAAVSLLGVLVPLETWAQESRAGEIAAQQAEKATRLRPYEPERGEAIMIRAERALSAEPTGLYPWLGSIFSGGLLAFGPGFRVPFGGGGAIDSQVAISLKGYKLARATVFLPPMVDRRVRLALRADVVDASAVAFYGVGNETTRDDRATFRFRPATVGVVATVRPARYVDLGGEFGVMAIDSGAGTRGTSIVDRFSSGHVPGYLATPTYAVTRAHAAVDWRDSAGYSRRGGYYRLDWSNFGERGDGPFSFRRVDADLRQMVPLLRENWVLAFRAAVSTTSTDAGKEVPFFLMPQLGGGSDLRAYPSWRFRDRHRALFSAEYRWTPSHFIDMAIFHDAGKVTAERSQLGFRGLKHTNGIGIRFHAPAATFLRFEVARGAEGLGLIMAFGQSF